MAVRMVSLVSPSAAMACALSFTRTAGRCPPASVTQPDAGDTGNFLRHAGFDHVFHLRHWHGGRGDSKGHDRRIRRVYFAVDRRVRQV